MDSGKARVLLVANSAPESLVAWLSGSSLDVTTALPAQALARLESSLFDLSLVVVNATSESTSWVTQLHEGCADTPVIAVGPGEPDLMHRALAAGAIEYLSWPSPIESALQLLQQARLRSHALGGGSPSPTTSSGLLGSSPQLAAARETLARAAPGVATVLVRGETGTGKELAARAIHAQSLRGAAPFIKLHTPALPDALLESELFGYEKGAFTGAVARKPGRVELAEGGTLFLDEIGEISPVMQAKLLRLLQDREFERLGGTRTLRADIRVVAATHRDLEHLVDSGEFREDLFYRLNVVTLWLPPLRARRQDISPIAEHYLQRFCRANNKQLTLDASAHHALQAERWPGNVRQLVNLIERLVVLAEHDHVSGADVHRQLNEQQAFLTQAVPGDGPSLPPPSDEPAAAAVASDESAPGQAEAVSPAVSNLDFSSAVRPLKEDVRRAELRAISKALHAAKGNRALAARLLGVSRRTLYTKLAEHGIE
jgi:two-component system response regulator AtoC